MAITQAAYQDIELGRGGSYSLSRDVLKHSVWDILPVPDVVTDLSFFASPQGAQIQYPGIAATVQKTRRETNIADSGKLPNGQTFLIKRMGVYINGIGSKDSQWYQAATTLLGASVFDITIAGRPFDFQIHGRQFMPNISMLPDYGNNFQTRAGEYFHSGYVSLEPTPVFVDQLVSFGVTLRMGSGDPVITNTVLSAFSFMSSQYTEIGIVLEGTLTRAK